MPSRIPETFAYPVIYPNGVIVYYDTAEEAAEEQARINSMEEEK